MLKACSHITSGFAFASNFSNEIYDNKHALTFAFSRRVQQRSQKNANVEVTCEWILMAKAKFMRNIVQLEMGNSTSMNEILV